MEITERLARTNAARKLLIIDACYSARAGATLFTQAFVEGNLPSGLCLLASSSPYESSIAPADKPLTSFTSSLVSVLEAGIADQGPVVSTSELFGALEAFTDKRKLPKPWIVAQGGSADSIFFRNPASVDAQEVEPDVYSDTNMRYDHRAEILYVDDQPRYRNSFKKALEHAGHGVVVASGPGDAAAELRKSYFDIIVVDLLETGDAPVKDLIQVCGNTAPDSELFLVSRRSKGTKELWTQLHAIFPYPNRISAFLWKPDYIGAVTEFANLIRDTRRRVLSHVENLQEAAPLIAGRMIKRDKDLLEQSDGVQLQVRVTVERLVAKWFDPQNNTPGFVESMTLRPVDSGRSVCSVFTLVPGLRGVMSEDVMPLVLKIGPADEIKQEEERYDRFVQVGVPLDLRTDKIGAAYVGRVGGILYSFRGARDGAINEIGQLGSDEIAKCLEIIFNPKTGRKWSAARAVYEVHPLDHYRSLGYEEFARATSTMKASVQELRRKATSGAGQAVDDKCDIKAVYEWSVMNAHHASTLVHGDLNLGNMVKCQEGRYALIDYRTVGIGPRLVDFATIEVACWLTAPAPERSRPDLFVEACVAVTDEFTDPRDPLDIPDWLRAPWELAMQSRRLAFDNFDDATVLEYATLLWLAAVRRSEFKSSARSASERRTLSVLPPAIALAAQSMIAREEKEEDED